LYFHIFIEVNNYYQYISKSTAIVLIIGLSISYSFSAIPLTHAIEFHLIIFIYFYA